jgi:2-methylisocitrate lyase-like PEP mutase family enzyme
MVREITVITASVDVPMTADVEAGYGKDPPDAAETIRQVIQAKAVGVNLDEVTRANGTAEDLPADRH